MVDILTSRMLFIHALIYASCHDYGSNHTRNILSPYPRYDTVIFLEGSEISDLLVVYRVRIFWPLIDSVWKIINWNSGFRPGPPEIIPNQMDLTTLIISPPPHPRYGTVTLLEGSEISDLLVEKKIVCRVRIFWPLIDSVWKILIRIQDFTQALLK